MRIILNEADTEDALDQIIRLATELKPTYRDLHRRRITSRDGYPTRASGAEPRTGHDNEKDEDGNPLPARPSDPTANIVVSRDEITDPIGQALAQGVAEIRTALRHLDTAKGQAASTNPPTKPETPADEMWCTSCLRANHFTPRYDKSKASRLCRWCWDFQHAHDHLPSLELIDRHARTGRVTQRDIDQDRRPKNKQR